MRRTAGRQVRAYTNSSQSYQCNFHAEDKQQAPRTQHFLSSVPPKANDFFLCNYTQCTSHPSSLSVWCSSPHTPGPSPLSMTTTSVAKVAGTSALVVRTTATILPARLRQMCTRSRGAPCPGPDAASPCTASAAAAERYSDRRRRRIPRYGRRNLSRQQAAR